jgi:signal transduction histidine kinase
LRLRLTALYLLAALALMALIGAGSYWLLGRYFDTTTDLALQHKMVETFRGVGATPPPALLAADAAWYADRPGVLPALSPAPATSTPTPTTGHEEDRDEQARTSAGAGDAGQEQDSAPHSEDERAGDAYNGELAAIFVLPVTAQGEAALPAGTPAPLVGVNRAAVTAALAQGMDWRTDRLANGARVRLLTYRLDGGTSAALQLGRVLADQDAVLRRLLMGLLGLGGLASGLLGVASWVLAGRSLRPAQLAWERQQAFVANASHELRTPLTLMRAGAEVVQRTLPGDDTDRQALLADVLRECDYMSRLVEDLLLLSRLDAGALALERRAVDLPDLIADVQRQVGRLAAARGNLLIAEPVAGTVLGDPVRLRQVLLIVLDNALRYTPAGGTIRVTGLHQGRHVQITVADSGPGMAPAHLPHVFDRFYRTDEARQAASGGTGLGLAIAKALVEAHHGQIGIESRQGQGTRVMVILPLAGA